MATIKDGKGTIALCAFDDKAELKKHEFGRPAPGPNDVSIDIKFCGMCHSDLHACNGDWGINKYPIAPGHEVAGVVKDVGSDVTKYKVGDRVAVGCFVDACMTCELCESGQQNMCRSHVQTYSTDYPTGKGHTDCEGYHTNGGYSNEITVRSDFVFAVPDGIDLEYVGPLLCAGITMFSPLNKHVLKKGGNKKVGIVGFGGLGQIGCRLAKAMGCEVTFISRSDAKKAEAEAMGAKLLGRSDEEAMKSAAASLDVIIDTVAVSHEIAPLMSTLKVGGAYVCIGAIPQTIEISPFALIFNNHSIEGSLVGGIPETQEMLEFCVKHSILPEIKVIAAKDATEQFKALHAGTAGSTRAVIDMSTLAGI